MTYFKMLYDEEGIFGVAYAAEKGLFMLPNNGSVHDWKQLRLELRDGQFADYLANDLGCRLCSETLRGILQNGATPNDELQWLDVEVYRGDERRKYFLLHFPNPPDVLNQKKSICAGEFVVKPVLSQEAIEGHTVFSFPKGGELPLFVSEHVKGEVVAKGCTGIEFSPAAIR